MLKKTLRKVILLNEVLKIVFLLKKAFPKKMILECTNIFKKVLKKAIQKAAKEKNSQKSAEKRAQVQEKVQVGPRNSAQ